jgi:hypothetical protein
MDDLLIVGTTQSDTNVYLSGLSSFALNENGIAGRGGLYLYEESQDASSGGIRVLAEVPDVGAGYRLLDLMGVKRL